jgi:UMF1 family MFS transporter
MTARVASRRTRQVSWGMADWAREPFFSIVLSLVLPPYFVASIARDAVAGTAAWGYALTTAALLLIVLAPAAGSIADRTPHRKRWIATLTAMGALALVSLWSVSLPGWILPVLALCVLAQVSIELMRVFTDRLMPEVARPDEIGRLSGLGVGLGFAASFIYLGVLQLVDHAQGANAGDGLFERAAVAGTGVWLAVFMLPLMLYGPSRAEAPPARMEQRAEGLQGYFGSAIARLRADRQLLRFLVARMAYWDGTMALFSFFTIVASTTLHWSTAHMTTFGLLGLVAGSAAGLLAGRVESRLGARNTLAVSIAGMLLCTLVLALAARSNGADTGAPAFTSERDRIFLAMGVSASALLGLIMSSSRSLLVGLAPAERLGEYFGLYAMVGRASSFLAPLLVALGTTVSGDQRVGVFGIALILLAAGLLLLWRVDSVRQ